MEKIYLNLKYDNNKSTKGYVLDISYNGIGIASRAKIKKNSKIEIIINEPKKLTLEGVIVSSLTRKRKVYRYRLGIKLKSAGKTKKNGLAKIFLNKNKRRAPRFPLSISWKQD